MIIGGLIGVASSAVTALIQGHYSLKGKREDNLARQNQQSTQIQHEKDSQLLSRRIAVRSRYLEPLTSHLSALYTSLGDYRLGLIGIITAYRRAGEEIQVKQADKKEFMGKLDEIESKYETIGIAYDKATDASSQVADSELIKGIADLSKGVRDFYQGHVEMYGSLGNCEKEQDFVHDFKEIMNSIRKGQLSISTIHGRIEYLLAGVD